ncbi:hypothetical protein BH10BAC5_BH10BAC5_16820 [soil metagenome]
MNWKTTLAGLSAALLLNVIPLLQTGQINWQMVFVGIAISVLGLLAKDADTTGVGKNATKG